MQDEKTLEFLQKLKESGHWNDDYDYSKVVCNRYHKDKILVIDEIGCEHAILPYNLINGNQLSFKSVLNKEEYFIKKSTEIHDNKYDYTKVEYFDSKSKVIIICPEHGEFAQSPAAHLQGVNCFKCAVDTRIKDKDILTSEFVKKCKSVYGDKYNYNKTEFIDYHTKILVIDENGFEHLQDPRNHLKGGGLSILSACDKTSYFLNQVKLNGKIDEKIDYSKLVFINKKTEVILIDEFGFEHRMLPSTILNGDSNLNIRSVIDKQTYFISQSKIKHKNKYDYSNTQYINSIAKVTIICPEHGEFEQTPYDHMMGKGCRNCGYNSISSKKSIGAINFIKLATEIHGDKYDYSKVDYKNGQKNIIIIDEFGFEHKQKASYHLSGGQLTIQSAVNKSEYCIFKFKEIHNNRYDYSKVNYINANTKVKIICPEHGEFEQTPVSHWDGKGCSKCAGIDKLTTTEIVRDFIKKHGNRYDYSKVNYIDGKTKVTIICPEHGEFEQLPFNHKKGSNCQKCSGSYMDTEYFIEKARKTHGSKYDYSKTVYLKKEDKVTIICPEHGEFEQNSTSHISGANCPHCAGSIVNVDIFINNAKKIHGDKYDYSRVDYTRAIDKVFITCPRHGEFEQTPNSHLNGTGCPVCGTGFIKSYKLKLIKDLLGSDLLAMDPVELQIIIQQGALPNDFRPLVNTEAESDERIATLRELQERYESSDEPEEAEVFATAEAASGDTQEEEELVEVDDVDDDITETEQEEREPRLPSVNAVRDLHSLDNSIYASMDEEAFETLIQYKIRKYWNETLNEATDISKLRNETGGKYFTSIKDEFLDEYDNVLQITPSEGYVFKHQPNLMQKLTVYRLLKNKHYGNWSGTGAGKTLSFILASRNMDARLTLVIALNSTIKQTCKSIKEVYPNSKCFTDYKEGHVFDRCEHNYLVLNYEKFQQENSEKLFQSLTNNNQIDFVVIDEVHNAKQRVEGDEHESIRRGVMVRLLGRARENENLHVLAMSATPVINELFEAKSLLQLMSGLEYNDLQTRRTIGNAIKIFQQLTLNGLRFIPKYDIQLTELTGRNMTNLSIDGSHLLERLLELPQNDYIGVEKLILDDKLKAVTPYIRKGTIIYTYFTTGIVNNIQKHVENLGFKVGTYTGDESSILRESNLKDFISGKIDILIGSKPIGTGVDGLQGVSDRMICITLPWTDSEYTQLKGRIYRQGSEFDEVEIVIPQVRIQLEDGDVWSWDIQRLNLIKNKKTLADAAVDGVIPSNILPSKETMFRKSIESLKNWQDRVSAGNIVSSERNIIQMDLYPELDGEDRERRINSELSEFNRRGKTTHSSTMHREFSDNPDSWHRYHALRKSRMESWEEIPYEYIATKIKDHRDVIADFGCGENLFKHCVSNNKVHSFDHIAIDDTVTACDMRNTGLGDETIDVTVFSLALWGTNSNEYIKEAYRVLRRKGMIYIAEPSKNYDTSEEQDKLINVLNEIGFQQVGSIENRGKFVYLTGIKI
jgi:superfamily II DNA or RNA helicase